MKIILESREQIFTKEKLAKKENKKFNLEEEFSKLKNQIREKIEWWFKAFNIEFAYQKARKVPNMLVHSHRISGWSNPMYKVTDNLLQQVKTNFGYGSVSYFYSLLIFKNIEITPLSEWVDYRYSNFSEVIRYTRRFIRRIGFSYTNGIPRYIKIIKNSYWNNAIEFTKNAANLSLTNEQGFVDKYIIRQCEWMVSRLDIFSKETEFDFIYENQLRVENEEMPRYRVDIKGYELIDFRTEKIIGALDFITKIVEYNTITPTREYTERIIAINKRFIPNVYDALDKQNIVLKEAKKDYYVFLKEHNKLIEIKVFYERLRLRNDFVAKHKKQYDEFFERLTKSSEKIDQQSHKIELHTNNINKLTKYINKYKEIVKE